MSVAGCLEFDDLGIAQACRDFSGLGATAKEGVSGHGERDALSAAFDPPNNHVTTDRKLNRAICKIYFVHAPLPKQTRADVSGRDAAVNCKVLTALNNDFLRTTNTAFPLFAVPGRAIGNVRPRTMSAPHFSGERA